jgi:hypothetical protein
MFGTLKCTYERTVHRGLRNVKNLRSVHCTAAGTEELKI